MSSKKPIETGFIDWRMLLSTAAVLISLLAITLQWVNPSQPSGKASETTVLMEEMEDNTRQQLVMIQELNKQLRALEAQQEYQTSSIQMQSKRIDSLFSKVITESAPNLAQKKTAATVPKTDVPAVGWAVNLMSMDDKEGAKKEKEHLNELGIPAEISPFYIDNVLKYRLHIRGFPDQETAELYKKKLATKYNIKDTWVHKP